jgi:hypothetical protein
MFFGFFWPVSTTPGKNVFAGVNDTADKLFAGVNDTAGKLLTDVYDTVDKFSLMINCNDNRCLQIGTNWWYLRQPKLVTDAYGVVGTAIKSCIHRHPPHLVSLTPVRNLSRVSLTLAINLSTVLLICTSEQLITGVVDTSDKHSFTNISANFRKNLKRP